MTTNATECKHKRQDHGNAEANVARVMEALWHEPMTPHQIELHVFPCHSAVDARRVTQLTLAEMTRARLAFGPYPDGTYQLTDHARLGLTATQRRPLRAILPVAERLRAELAPHALRLEIGGSVRRRKDQVRDIELCALAATDVDLFGRTMQTAATPGIAGALHRMSVAVLKSGPKYTKVIVEDAAIGAVAVDLFVTADPECWGMLFFIRTGSAEFARRAVTHWTSISKGGHCRGNKLYRADGTHVPTPDVVDVFNALQCRYVWPQERVTRD